MHDSTRRNDQSACGAEQINKTSITTTAGSLPSAAAASNSTIDHSKDPAALLADLSGARPVEGRAQVLGCSVVKSREDVEYLAPSTAVDRPSAYQLYELLRGIVAQRGDLEMLQTDTLHYETSKGPVEYPFFMIKSREISPDDPILIVRANVHGREIGTALTILNELDAMADYAHARGIKLVVLPLDNPSAYDTMNYRNIEVTEKGLADQEGWVGNNFGCTYILRDGREVTDVGDRRTTLDPVTGMPFDVTGWRHPLESESVRPFLPNETVAALKALESVPPSQVIGCLDLHQDPFCTVPLAYQFGFRGSAEDYAEYDGILKKVGTVVHLMTNHDNEAHEFAIEGYEGTVFVVGESAGEVATDSMVAADAPAGAASAEFRDVSDSRGFITHHDGALPCLYSENGANHCLVLEVSSVTPQADAERVYMAWICGVIDLASKRLS